MIEGVALAVVFFLGRYSRQIWNVAHGLWLAAFNPLEFEKIVSAVEAREQVETAKDKALSDARARMANIYEQAPNIEMARKMCRKGVEIIDAANTK